MSVSIEFLERCAADTGFAPATLEKVIRLGELAGDVGRHPLLRGILALKGGTALNLGLKMPPRLSVDLDFNYVGALDRSRMLEDRPTVEGAIEDLAARRGYRVQRSRDEHAGRKIFLRYPSTAGPEDRIEIDLNYLFRQPIGETRWLELWQPGGLDRPRVLGVSSQELVAGKLLALLDRSAVRDAYDVMRLPEADGVDLKSSELRRTFIAVSIVLSLPLTSYGRDRLDRITAGMVEQQLAEMLTRDDRIGEEELKQAAWAVAERFVTLSEREASYVDTAMERGVLRLELLFDEGSESAQALERHPALLRKIHNVRHHLGLGGP